MAFLLKALVMMNSSLVVPDELMMMMLWSKGQGRPRVGHCHELFIHVCNEIIRPREGGRPRERVGKEVHEEVFNRQ